MASKRKPPKQVPDKGTPAEQASRLYRLLALLGEKPQTREALVKRLKRNIRGFYRDLKVLRELGIEVALQSGRYVLLGSAIAAQERLPLPDPGLTIGEAQQLARGRTAAHNKLKQQITIITD